MTLSTDFSSTCWLIAFSCVNVSDLDILQSVHVDKLKELSKELTYRYNGQLEKLVFCVHKFGVYLLTKRFAQWQTRCWLMEQSIGDALWRITHLCAFL